MALLQEKGYLALAYLLPIVVNIVFIESIVRALWDRIGVNRYGFSRGSNLIGRLIGMLETVLYVTSIIMNAYVFVVIWLTLKTAGKWKALPGDLQATDTVTKISQASAFYKINRNVFYVFVIGNGLSILNALAGLSISRLLGPGGGDDIWFFPALCLYLFAFSILRDFVESSGEEPNQV